MSSDRNGGDNWLDGFVPYQLYRITNNLTQRLRARLREQPVSISHWRVLSGLRARGTLTINEIAELTAMEQPTVSRVVTRLVEDGLVSRRASSRDSRFMEITLTEQGHGAFDEIYPIAQQHQDAALQGLSAAEIDTLQTLLLRIQKNIDAD